MDEVARILAYLHARSRKKSEIIEVPPFTLYLHLRSLATEDSLALPSTSLCEEVTQTLPRIASFFQKRNRIVRIQFLDQLAPRLEVELVAAGCTLHEKLPLLYCTPDQLCRPDNLPNLQITMVNDQSSDNLLAEAWTLNALGFARDAPAATPDDVNTFRPMLVGGRAFSAYMAEDGVGAGMFNEPMAGVAELVGITTLHPFRRRGIATALTAAITAAAFESGARLAYLVAASPEASRIYLRVGYQFCGHLVTFVVTPDWEGSQF